MPPGIPAGIRRSGRDQPDSPNLCSRACLCVRPEDDQQSFSQTAERHGKLTGYANSHDKPPAYFSSRPTSLFQSDGMMESPEQFIKYAPWTPAEKKAARKAFDQALRRHLSAIIAEARSRMANVADPSDLWELEAYLTESRKTIDRVYRYRYSDLLRVFARLMRDGWLREADLVGLQAEKIAEVKDGAEAFRRIFDHTDEADRS